MSFSLLLATKRRLFVSYAFPSSSASTTLKPYGLRWKSSISRRSWPSLVLPSSGSPDDACGDDLPKLQRRIDALNGGVHINVRSPKQVSTAIFGSPQSATKQKIEQATKDLSLSPEKRELASLIILEQTISSKKLKTRHLSQTVSPAKPNYMSAGDNTDTSADLLDQLPASRPCVGVIHTSAGYHLVEVSMEERSVTYSERLTQEAVSCRLEAYPPADPLLFIPTPNEEAKAKTLSGGAVRPDFLPRSSRRSLSIESGEGRLLDASATIDGAPIRVKSLSPSLVPSSKLAGGTDAARYNQAVVAFFLEQNQEPTMSEHSQPGTRRTTFEDFTMVQSTSCTNPLYKETARQLGLMEDPNIPSLVFNVLDETAPAATRKFLHRYLMVPPPPEVAQAMASVVKALMDPQQAQSLPKLVVPRLGKMLTFILEGKADASIYAELLKALGVTRCLLQQEKDNIPIDALLTLSSHGSGLFAKRDSFLERCQQGIEAIETVLSHEHHVTGDLQPAFVDDRLLDTVTNDRHIPQSFFDRHEASWRGQIQREIAPHAYRRVEEMAEALCHAVKEDFIRDNNANEGLIKSDSDNLIFALPKIPENAREAAKDFHRPRNRFNKVIDNRFTTKRVENAMSDYKEACDAAHAAVRSALTKLAQHLQDNDHIPTIRQSTHFNLALSAAFHHTKKATHRGWHLAEVVDSSESAKFVGLWPYWMPNSTAVSNDFDLDGMFLLTAPNMSGKSTLMRSTAAAALLTVCGLCAPLKEGSWVPQFDTLFLRGASADVPAENKSALGAEMEDIAAQQRCSSNKSLVFVDEIGRGTSPRDGTLLAAAILENMARKGMTGIFATHLHDLLKLPLHSQERIIEKQMDLVRKNEQWTYKLKDGVCYDSLALVTAEQFGLSQDIIRRAKELGHYLPQDDFDRMAPMTSRLINNIDAKDEDPSKLDFGGMQEIAESITGQKSYEVPPGHNPPPSLEGAWCIYLLELLYDAHPLYYVGESGNISDRLRTHRNRGPEWSQSRSFVIPVANKSEARRYESRLIQYLVQSGVSMKSTTDGLSKRLG